MTRCSLSVSAVFVFLAAGAGETRGAEKELPHHQEWIEVPSTELPGSIDGFRYVIIDETIQSSWRRSEAGVEASSLMAFAEEFIVRWEVERDFDRVAEMYADDDLFQDRRENFARMASEGKGEMDRRYRYLVEYGDYYFLLGEKGMKSGFISVIGTYRWDGERWWRVYRTPHFLNVSGDKIRDEFFRQRLPAIQAMLIWLMKQEVSSKED